MVNALGPVVIGVDEAGTATAALDWAVELCDDTAAELVAVTAVSSEQAELPPRWHADMIEDARRRLSSQIRVAGDATRHRSLVIEGDAAAVLERAVDDESASVVVLGAHDDEGSSRVTEALSHHLEAAVVIVPQVGGRIAHGKIVVGVDGSDGSQAALQWAASVAARTRASLHAVYAYEPLADSYPHGPVENWRYRGQQDVEAQVNTLNFDGDIELTLVGADPIAALAQVGEQDDAALVVVGTKGRGGLHGLVLGRVPSQLPRDAHRPVAVIHHRGDARPVVDDRTPRPEVARGWHRVKGRMRQVLGWLTADRVEQAKGEAELRVGEDPTGATIDRVERDVKERYGETLEPHDERGTPSEQPQGMEAMLDAVDRLRAAGYLADFEPRRDAELQCSECGRTVAARAVVVDERVRFEGESNPGDEAILVALTSPCGHRGLYRAAFGASAPSDDAVVLQALGPD